MLASASKRVLAYVSKCLLAWAGKLSLLIPHAWYELVRINGLGRGLVQQKRTEYGDNLVALDVLADSRRLVIRSVSP